MTTAPMNGDEDRPVTRRELKAELAELKAELKAEFPTKQEMRGDIASAMAYVVDTIGARIDRMQVEMGSMRDDLSRDLARHVRAAAEENRRFLATLDDEYRDVPGRVTVLERDLDEHRRDTTLHPPRRRR